jgi:hypothetical protein
MQETPIPGVVFRYIKTNNIKMRIAQMGDTGPPSSSRSRLA